jgi:hypothetical protein
MRGVFIMNASPAIAALTRVDAADNATVSSPCEP